MRREELAELERTDVEERAAAEPDVGDVRVVDPEEADLIALALDRGVVEGRRVAAVPLKAFELPGRAGDPLALERVQLGSRQRDEIRRLTSRG